MNDGTNGTPNLRAALEQTLREQSDRDARKLELEIKAADTTPWGSLLFLVGLIAGVIGALVTGAWTTWAIGTLIGLAIGLIANGFTRQARARRAAIELRNWEDQAR